MGNHSQLVSLVSELIEPGEKGHKVSRLAEFLGVEAIIVFLLDAEAGVLLSAPGFPQTLPDAGGWKLFLEECMSRQDIESAVPWPTAEKTMPARGVAYDGKAVIAFIGGNTHTQAIEEMLRLLPLLSSALRGEAIRERQAAEATFAAEIARQSATLARRLDESRRAVHKELKNRTEAERLLRIRESELHAMVRTLEETRAELQRHADQMEEHVAERTAKLVETVGELEAFSYSIAHDMRAPLRAMQGYASYVMEESGTKLDGASFRALEKISSSAVRMDRLIQDVLNYSRLVRSEFELIPINLNELVPNVIDSYQDWHPPKAEVLIEGKLPTVLGNEAFLTQCISNLIGNAVKFVKPGTVPQAIISATTTDDKVTLHVRDNGIGFEEKDAQRIFKIFERLHAKKEYEGTGIGLAIVRKAAERMGGAVWAHSEPGKGSVFSLELKGYVNG